MNETRIESFFEQKPFIDNLPKPDMGFNFNKPIATGIAVATLAGVGTVATSLSIPERASAQASELCTAPTGEVPTQTKPNIAGKDLAVDTIALSTKVCENTLTEARTSIRNTGSVALERVEVFIEGSSSVVESIKSVNIDGDTWPVVPFSDTKETLKICEIDKDAITDRDGYRTSYIVCSRRWGITLMPGESQPVGFNFATDVSSLKPGKFTSKRSGAYIRVSDINIESVGGKLVKREYPNTEQTRPFDLWDSAGTNVIMKSQVKGVAEGGSGTYSSGEPNTCKAPIANLVRRNDDRGFNVAIKPRSGQTVNAKGNGADKSASVRNKAARVSVAIPKGAKVPKVLPKNMIRVGNQVLIDVTKNINSKKYWQTVVPIKTNKKVTAKSFMPKGTVNDCQKSTIYYLKAIEQK